MCLSIAMPKTKVSHFSFTESIPTLIMEKGRMETTGYKDSLPSGSKRITFMVVDFHLSSIAKLHTNYSAKLESHWQNHTIASGIFSERD